MKVYFGKNVISSSLGPEENAILSLDDIVVTADKTEKIFSLSLNKSSHFILLGTLHYYLDNEELVVFEDTEDYRKKFSNFLEKKSISEVQQSLEGHFVAFFMNPKGEAALLSDSFAREDIFYIQKGDSFIASTGLSEIEGHREDKSYDQVALANFFNVYGYYAPKTHTFYNGIKRLGVGQYLLSQSGSTKIMSTPFEPALTKEFTASDHERYFEYFSSAIETRSTDKGINWIYMSSGWDSSSILATLCHIHGPSKIKCVIGRLKYSEEFGVNNNFEIERAQKLTDYFKVPLEIIDMDFCSAAYLEYNNKLLPELKSKALYAFTAYTFYRMAEFIKINGTVNDAVFSGEISDGAHNMGFSQFATLLHHPDLGFREYSDKMASYLFGPSFLKLIEENKFDSDIIYELLRTQKGLPKPQSIASLNNKKWKELYAASLFVSPYRFPFAPLLVDGVMTKLGQEKFLNDITEEYFSEFAENVNAENLYSWWLHLYNSWHWQGSTVGVTLKSPGAYNVNVACPFWDKRLMNFLSEMPEDWGRGLSITKTKFPLKWVLENKIDYPNHLQTGPHSYIYDVNSSWSAEADFIYGSAGVEGYKKLLKSRPYHKYLNPEFFNIAKLDSIVDDYIAGKKVSGHDRSNLVRLVCLCNVGLY